MTQPVPLSIPFLCKPGWILNPFNQPCFNPKRSSEITFAADSFPADPPCPRSWVPEGRALQDAAGDGDHAKIFMGR